MALPFQFANVTTLVTSQLDANYNALGALTPIPCTASGTNAITMTPNANTPTVSAYSNYMQFTAVAASSNTTAATAAVGSLAALNIYKDSVSGPIALSANDIVANCQFTLIYDSTLNTGSGGFHLISETDKLSLSGGGTVSGVVLFSGNVQFGNINNSGLVNAQSASVSIGWPNIPANTSSISTIAMSGCSIGDVVSLGTPSSVPLGVIFFGYVASVNTVIIQATNTTGSSITPVAGLYRATSWRFSP